MTTKAKTDLRSRMTEDRAALAADHDQQTLLASALDREARNCETLSDWARARGHDVERVVREFEAGNLRIRRRQRHGLLGVSIVDEDLRAEVEQHGALRALNAETESN